MASKDRNVDYNLHHRRNSVSSLGALSNAQPMNPGAVDLETSLVVRNVQYEKNEPKETQIQLKKEPRPKGVK